MWGLRRAGILAVLVAGGATSVMAQVCPTVTAAQDIDVRPDYTRMGKPFEGWGTALAWFANVTGGYPDPVRNRLADLLYGEQGLRWNIARYNIGGGNAPDIQPYLRKGADLPGFWRRPAGATGQDWWRPDEAAMWDWSADARQRWWLDAIHDRVDNKVLILEAFSNSPPYFMTQSGLVSGNDNRLDNNIKPGASSAFADYLVRVTARLEQSHGVHFRTLSPVNEPATPYWHAKNTQEGSHWTPEAQQEVIVATAKALGKAGLKTRVAAMDETDSLTFIRNWQAYTPETRALIGQLNVHSYDTFGQTGVRDIASSSNIRLWMSENDLSPQNVRQDFDDMRPPLALAERITLDLKKLKPVAWVFWQAVENVSPDPQHSSNWGLIKMDYSVPDEGEHTLTISRKYYAMANFSRHIRPGYRLFEVADMDTTGAVSPDGKTVVFVHVNAGPYARNLKLPSQNLPSMKVGQAHHVELYVTDAAHEAARLCGDNLTASGMSVQVPPQSISTLVITQAPS
ncbi:glycoside hydrolase [Asticcacaulis sp. MM231]|uniref:glycoside hydrolase n=1 Tax=Asticcacaulis sp. MM231 TaxID=3157666 RepID=UPI0032D58F03